MSKLKLSLQVMVMSLLMSPFNIETGWCMNELNELKEDLNSAKRKVTRIQNAKIKHTFVEKNDIIGVSAGEAFRGINDRICKNCDHPKSHCHGFGGGIEEKIKRKAKKLNNLLKEMETTMTNEETILFKLGLHNGAYES